MGELQQGNKGPLMDKGIKSDDNVTPSALLPFLKLMCKPSKSALRFGDCPEISQSARVVDA